MPLDPPAKMQSSLSVVYSGRYDIRACGLERLHPFDTRKHSRAFWLLRQRFGARLDAVIRRVDRAASDDELRTVHTSAYLASLRRSSTIAEVLEVPQAAKVPAWILRRLILTPMRWAVRGSILAGHAAIDGYAAINLAGGFHHAGPDRGEGFCAFADIAIMIHDLRRAEKLDPAAVVLYIDTDAHQGNGVARCFFDDDRVRIFDIYNGSIYPHDRAAERRINHPISLTSGTREGVYLKAMRDDLPDFIDHVASDRAIGLAVYNAGTDVYHGDKLGSLEVSQHGVLERDMFVIDTLTERGIKWVMLPSGGYSDESHRMIADTAAMLIDRWAPESA